MEYGFVCDDGVFRMLDISAEATAPFNCVYQERLQTPRGEGVVLGVYADQLYALLDTNAASLVATAFAKKDFDDGLLKVLPAVPPLFDPFDSHRIKHNVFCGRSVNLVTQDCNGPCPVVALANALVLMGRLSLSCENRRFVEAKQLRCMILKYITEDKPEAPRFVCPATRMVDGVEVTSIAGLAEQRLVEMRETLANGTTGEELLQRLYHGMNISPIFSFLDGFAAEEDVLLFALAGVRVVHGWLISPDDQYAVLRHMSFNEVSLLAATKDNGLSVIARDFLQSTKSQLTEEGLDVLLQELFEGEIVVFFWNNHFSTAVKLGGRLLLLLSDETYADRSSILFEAIEDVHGAVTYTDGNGADADPFLLAVQWLTGNEFSEEDVAAAKVVLQKADDSEPLPEAVVDYLRAAKQKNKSIAEGNKCEWAEWVREGASTLVAMGFDVSYTSACELVHKCGCVDAAVNELCQRGSQD